jgi:hypothetical protein
MRETHNRPKVCESASHKRMYRCKTTKPVCFPDAGGYLTQITAWGKVLRYRGTARVVYSGLATALWARENDSPHTSLIPPRRLIRRDNQSHYAIRSFEPGSTFPKENDNEHYSIQF